MFLNYFLSRYKFCGTNEATSDCLTEAMARGKLDFEILKMVENMLFDSPDFNLNKKIPSEVRVLRTGVFRTSFSDPHSSLNASLLTPVKFQ